MVTALLLVVTEITKFVVTEMMVTLLLGKSMRAPGNSAQFGGRVPSFKFEKKSQQVSTFLNEEEATAMPRGFE